MKGRILIVFIITTLVITSTFVSAANIKLEVNNETNSTEKIPLTDEIRTKIEHFLESIKNEEKKQNHYHK